MTCDCPRHCATQEALQAAHGTPDEFKERVYLAYCDLFISRSEADEAIKNYNALWGSMETNVPE